MTRYVTVTLTEQQASLLWILADMTAPGLCGSDWRHDDLAWAPAKVHAAGVAKDRLASAGL